MDGSSNSWFYVAACILVPAAWGAVSAWLFARLDKRRAPKEEERAPRVDYMI